MSRHDGVSCDSCMKGNFRGRRYKCLVCYDYDLCASCYEAGASTTRHLADHPMQCILTRSDFELYYGGEGVSIEQPQSLTCPYCTRMGFTETTLQEHVAADHPDTSFEVICPVCAYLPGGEPNLATDDIAGHLTLEHRSGPRDLITFLDDSASNRSSVRRIPHTARGVGSSRSRRSNMHFSSSGGLSPSSREGIDPIAELLSQLSGVRRTGASGSVSGSAVQSSSAPSQLQQLQMQLQIERQQVRAARQQLERLPKRQTQVIGSVAGGAGSSGNHSSTMSSVVPSNAASNNNVASSANPSSVSASSAQNSTFLLPRSIQSNLNIKHNLCIASTPSDSQLQSIERESANRSLFTRELVVSTLVEALPDLTSSQQQVASSAPTPASSVSTAMSSPETPNATSASSSSTATTAAQQQQQQQPQQQQQQQQQATLKKSQDAGSKREQGSSALSKQSTATQQQQQQQQHQAAATTASQGLPANPNSAAAAAAAAAAVSAQSAAPVVQTLMHVIPQPLVLQQPLPIRNTGTGTIRQQIGVPTAAVAAYPQRGSSAAQSRRKPVRTVDGRNQSTEPPPPH